MPSSSRKSGRGRKASPRAPSGIQAPDLGEGPSSDLLRHGKAMKSGPRRGSKAAKSAQPVVIPNPTARTSSRKWAKRPIVDTVGPNGRQPPSDMVRALEPSVFLADSPAAPHLANDLLVGAGRAAQVAADWEFAMTLQAQYDAAGARAAAVTAESDGEWTLVRPRKKQNQKAGPINRCRQRCSRKPEVAAKSCTLLKVEAAAATGAKGVVSRILPVLAPLVAKCNPLALWSEILLSVKSLFPPRARPSQRHTPAPLLPLPATPNALDTEPAAEAPQEATGACTETQEPADAAAAVVAKTAQKGSGKHRARRSPQAQERRRQRRNEYRARAAVANVSASPVSTGESLPEQLAKLLAEDANAARWEALGVPTRVEDWLEFAEEAPSTSTPSGSTTSSGNSPRTVGTVTPQLELMTPTEPTTPEAAELGVVDDSVEVEILTQLIGKPKLIQGCTEEPPSQGSCFSDATSETSWEIILGDQPAACTPGLRYNVYNASPTPPPEWYQWDYLPQFLLDERAENLGLSAAIHQQPEPQLTQDTEGDWEATELVAVAAEEVVTELVSPPGSAELAELVALLPPAPLLSESEGDLVLDEPWEHSWMFKRVNVPLERIWEAPEPVDAVEGPEEGPETGPDDCGLDQSFGSLVQWVPHPTAVLDDDEMVETGPMATFGEYGDTDPIGEADGFSEIGLLADFAEMPPVSQRSVLTDFYALANRVVYPNHLAGRKCPLLGGHQWGLRHRVAARWRRVARKCKVVSANLGTKMSTKVDSALSRVAYRHQRAVEVNQGLFHWDSRRVEMCVSEGSSAVFQTSRRFRLAVMFGFERGL